MDAIIAQAKSLAKTADEGARKNLLDALRDLSYSLETPQDTIQRVQYQHLQIAVVRIGCDLKLFNILVESPTPLTVDSLAQKTGAAPTLLGRILRYLASVGIIKETDANTFTKSNLTETFATSGFRGGVHHNFDVIGPVLQAFPEFLAENHYQDITDPLHTPHQKAFKTDLPAFVWYPTTKPETFAHFQQFMSIHRDGMPTWLDVYPWQERMVGLKPDQAFFIDLGGGIGHQSIALRQKVPQLPSNIIVQDIPATLEYAIKYPGVETMVQDFFQPQVVNGARIYYMRNVIHDYPDERALIILKNTRAALGPDSVILIDDMVVPNSGAHWYVTQCDLVMMAGLAAMERTKDQWYSLLERAGLKINKIYTYTTSLQDSVIECVAADGEGEAGSRI